MREIKFRAWDEEEKQMLETQDLSSPREFWAWLGLIDVVLMQFTGLKDKNGKEIYEGDIVHNGYGGPYYTRKMIVCWLDYHAGWSLATDIKNIGDWAIKMEGQLSNGAQPRFSSYKIIGNIYENPELLEEKHG